MTRRFDPQSWPLTVKVPLLVAGLMVAVAMTISQIVLARLTETQESNLRQLTATYLDGLFTAVMPHVLRQDAWEVFDLLDRTRHQYTDVKATQTVVTQANGTVLAASDPKTYPIGTPFKTPVGEAGMQGRVPVIDEEKGIAWATKELRQDDRVLGAIHAAIDIRPMFATRRSVMFSLIVGNVLLTLLFAGGGYVAVRRMVDPIRLVGEYVEHIRDGNTSPYPQGDVFGRHTEFGTLFRRLNQLSNAIAERESLATKLAEEEKLALIGKLTSAVAHEVNNPLGGMSNAIDTLRQHGDNPDVRETSLSLLERGLNGIAGVVRAALVTYRGRDGTEELSWSDVEDLRHLIKHIVKQRAIRLDWHNRLPETVEIEASAVRQVLLNLLLNACKATPSGGRVRFETWYDDKGFSARVEDDGPGLPDAVVQQFEKPDISELAELGGGLGVWTVATLVRRMEGRVAAVPSDGGGTRISVTIPEDGKDLTHAVA